MGHTNEKVGHLGLPHQPPPQRSSLMNSIIVDKIKSELIAKAKIKKAYRKLQEKEQKQKQVEGEQATSTQSILFGTSTAESGKNTLAEDEPGIEPASLELHPSRQERLEHDSEDEEAPSRSRKPRLRGPKRNKGYAVEQAKAEKIRREREEAVRKAKEAQKEKEKRERQRIRDKKLMTAKKADGRRKLGKQSIVLLERVKKQMAGAA